MIRFIWGVLALSFFSQLANAQIQPNWSERAEIPNSGRENIYQWSESEFSSVLREGRLHALNYPVSITGILLPVRPVENILSSDDSNPIKNFLRKAFQGINKLESLDEIQHWLGLVPYPKVETEQIPFKNRQRPDHRMGFTRMNFNGVEAFTISCAQCHSENLFGVPVLGMSNRFPRANEFFVKGKMAMPKTPIRLLKWLSSATDEEMDAYKFSKDNIRFVGGKKPSQLGLDTSLAQVSLSLARRDRDGVATKNPRQARNPRKEKLAQFVSDSKPAVWWNLKYKNRWLSDGSVVSGNPIFTNFIWNEIGRGTDLEELESWLNENSRVVEELTTAVFATEAPYYFDFFDADRFDIESAKRGEALFNNQCARCHGDYIKKWSLAESDQLPVYEQLKTHEVKYFSQTRVVDVMTDSNRYEGMTSLEQLNDLSISKANGILIRAQKGYVPPPMVGIWARWPYMHNNSMPSLCEVLTPYNERVKFYFMGEAEDKEADFDSDCNGYPVGDKVPEAWRMSQEFKFSNSREGASNRGHDRGIFVKDGRSIFSAQDKSDLIRFLQTL